MFDEMRLAAALQSVRCGPGRLAAADVVAMATRDGARALGLLEEIGTIEPGKRADLIVVGMSAARQTPVYDPVSHLVYTTRGDDVQTTIVNGRVLMRDRKMLSLDEAAVLAEARRWAVQVRAAVQ
jgi:5-methylthioadenosine/S-adenosylhomocysteine deaminase